MAKTDNVDELTGDTCRYRARELRAQAAKQGNNYLRTQMEALANEFDQLALNLDNLDGTKIPRQ